MRRLEKTGQEGVGTQARPSIINAKALLAALPLAASLMGGCSETDECRSYNETTVTLNRQADGKGIGMKELEGLAFLSEPMIDFINETHALATEGIPEDVRATIVPQYCSLEGGSFAPKHGYAVQDGDNRGIYFTEGHETDPISRMEIVNHEIGHLQEGNPAKGSEVIPQLNEYEQKMAGFALLAGQGAGIGELVRWVSYEGLHSLQKRLAMTLESGRGQPGHEPLNAYDKANMLIFLKLRELDGDFLALREEASALAQNDGLRSASDAAAGVFLAEYPSAADVFIEARIQQLAEIRRRFGTDMADSYFEANSGILGANPVSGLDGLNCTIVTEPAPPTYSACEGQICNEIGADAAAAVGLSLCCLGPDDSKWSVEANGTQYRKNGGAVTLHGFEWDEASHLTPTKTAIGMDEKCR